MIKSKTKHAVILFCVFFISLFSIGLAGEYQFSCNLGSNKVGPKPADTDAKGDVSFQLDENKQELFFKLNVREIKDVYMAHIHIGPDNVQGPIAVWLYPLHKHDAEGRCIDGEFDGTLSEGVIGPEDMEEGVSFDDLIEAMRNGNAYVNVHTKNYVPGEIRGQIHPGI